MRMGGVPREGREGLEKGKETWGVQQDAKVDKKDVKGSEGDVREGAGGFSLRRTAAAFTCTTTTTTTPLL